MLFFLLRQKAYAFCLFFAIDDFFIMKKIFSILFLSLFCYVCLAQEQGDVNYKLRPQDTLIFSMHMEPDMTTEAKVTNDGFINLPLINNVKVSELTLSEAREKITELYKADYFVDPQVTLNIRGYGEMYVKVYGQVNRPGIVPLSPEKKMRVSDAIAGAGGYTRLARTSKVIVRREGPNGVQNIRVDLEKPADDIEVMDGDHITVDERLW